MNFDSNDHNSEQSLYEQAAYWLERLSAGELDKVTARRFDKWLAQSSQHQQVFEAMLATWQDDALTQTLKKHQQTARKKWFSFVLLPQKQWQFAALALVLCIGLVQYFNIQPQVNPAEVYSYSVANNQQQDLQLTDGSKLAVGPATDIVVRMSDSRRVIQLKQGSTYFAVAKDKSRPFEVKVGNASVVAVGTEFNIDKGLKVTDVVVHEGAIEVRASITSQPVLLRAGEAIRIENGRLSNIEQVNLPQMIDWRSGWIELKNDSLQFLVERLNRHRDQPISILDAELNNLAVAGRFRLSNGEETLAMLQSLYPLKVHKKNGLLAISKP